MTPILARLFQFLIVFGSYQISIKLFDPSEYGKLTIFFVIGSFFILLTISPFGSYFLANAQKWHREDRVHSQIMIFLIVAIGLSIFVASASALGLIFFDDSELYLAMVGFYIFGSAVTQTFISLIAILYSIRASIFIANLNAVGCLSASLSFIYFLGRDIEFWILGQILFQCFFAFILFARYFYSSLSHLSWKSCTKFFKKSFKFATITSLISVLTWALYQSPKVLYSHLFDDISFGLVMAGLVLAGYVFAGFEALVNMYAQTFFYRDFDPESPNHAGAWSLYVFRVTFCFTAIFMISVPILDQVTMRIFTDEYVASRTYMAIGLICEYFRVVGGCFVLSGQYIQRPVINVIPLAYSSIFTVFLVLCMHLIFGLDTWLIVTTLPVGFLLYILIAAFRNRKTSNLSLDSFKKPVVMLIVSAPLFLASYISMMYVVRDPTTWLAFSSLIFCGLLGGWGLSFSKHLLGGRSLLTALLSRID